MRLLKEYVDNGQTQLTTDPLVTYDWLGEVWVVRIDDKTEAHIYGGNRGQRAKELAAVIRAGQYGDYNQLLHLNKKAGRHQ